jgi:7,8-dihydro-6-hydroxymethylpterin-pyrophosphokinase
MDEVRQACGNPRDTAANSDGSAVWTYVSGSPTYNPAPWGGWGAKFHNVTIMFDTSGKVKSWSTSTTNDGNSAPF